jgi:hypothetical protein
MADVQSVLADPKFQTLSQPDQLMVLRRVDPNFAKLSPDDQKQVIGHISNVVSIGGQNIDLKTGAGALGAATSQTRQQASASVQPINRTAGLLVPGPKTVPADTDITGTIAPSAGASSGLGILGNLTGLIRTQSTQQQQANPKNSLIGAGMSLVPELIPELAGGGAGATLANIGIRGANAGISGAGATVAGQALTGENPLDTESLKETGQNAVLSAGLGAGSKVIEAVPGVVSKAANAAKEAFTEPKAAPPLPELPSPVSSTLPVDTAFSDSIIRKLGAKDLSPTARETLRNAAGPVVQAGSSPELHLLKAVPEINSTISNQGAALDDILQNAKPLSVAPESAVTKALDDLRGELPGGQEETLGRAISKEQERYADALKSTDPKTVNETIRNLDERISDYSAPENQLEGPASAKDAALVTIRRTLRNILNTEIPESTPINKTLADNIEVRSFLRKKLGSVASDSSAANSQYQSELRLGQDQLARDTAQSAINDELAARKAKVQRNKTIAKTVGAIAGGAGLLQAGKTVAGSLIK